MSANVIIRTMYCHFWLRAEVIKSNVRWLHSFTAIAEPKNVTQTKLMRTTSSLQTMGIQKTNRHNTCKKVMATSTIIKTTNNPEIILLRKSDTFFNFIPPLGRYRESFFSEEVVDKG